MRRTLPLALGAAATVATVGAVAAVGSSGSPSATSSSRTVTVERGVIQSTVSGSGSLAAVRDRELAFASAGTIKHVLVSTGARVAKGRLLATLTTSDGTVKHLHAPFAGRIASVGISKGDTVGSSSSPTSSSGDTTTAFELVSLKAYDLSVSLSESDIGKVKPGQLATVTVDATGDKLAARVKHVALLPTSSSSSSTTSASSSSAVSYAVTLRLTQTAADLKPGMSASADIVTSQTSGLTVPTAALRGNQVTVVRNGKHSTHQVQAGVAGDSVTQIVSGLSAGDQVVVTSTTTRSTTKSSTASQRGFGGFGGGFAGGGPPAGVEPKAFGG